jgi:hypothetical protein
VKIRFDKSQKKGAEAIVQKTAGSDKAHTRRKLQLSVEKRSGHEEQDAAKEKSDDNFRKRNAVTTPRQQKVRYDGKEKNIHMSTSQENILIPYQNTSNKLFYTNWALSVRPLEGKYLFSVNCVNNFTSYV